MRREPQQLSQREWDLLVVGGGIHGAWAALDAAQRGLAVALIERGDFAGATSSNHQRIIHGGLRYLQSGDVRRLRESVKERSTLLRIAPDLIRPLPVVVPTLGAFSQRRSTVWAAMRINDLLSADRNRGLPEGWRIPRGRLLSAQEGSRLAEGYPFTAPPCTGAAVFFDAQVLSPERLVLSLVAGAHREGAAVANYVSAEGYLRRGSQVRGVLGRDVLSGETIEVRARQVLNCAGPWTAERTGALRTGEDQRLGAVKAALLVLRDLGLRAALAIPVRTDDAGRDRAQRKGYRNFFLSPWRGLTLAGTFYAPHDGPAGRCGVQPEDIDSWMTDLRGACPELRVGREDVLNVFCGLLPRDAAGSATDLARHPAIIDHEREDGIRGAISVSGVKFTTARRLAERAVDLACARLRRGGPGRTSATRLQPFGPPLIEDALASAAASSRAEALGDTVERAVCVEMACTLGDVILRRSDMGVAGPPGADVLDRCAREMARLLGWDDRRMDLEISRLLGSYPLLRRAAAISARSPRGLSAETPVHTP
jgi:glycerol-3-phosphate dehydrogenase